MRMRRSVGVGLGLVTFVTLAAPAWATMDNLKTYKQAHPDKAAKASCTTCHQNAIGKKGDLNPYGLALQQSKAPADAKKLTVDEINIVPEEQPKP